MKIYNIEKIIQDDKVTVSARYEGIGAKNGEHDMIFFEFDRRYQNHIHIDGTMFLAAFVIPCLIKGEDLHIEGLVEEQTLKGVQVILKKFIIWKKAKRKIKITVSGTYKSERKSDEIGIFFSGGVDSFFTYYSIRNTTKRIKYLIAVYLSP